MGGGPKALDFADYSAASQRPILREQWRVCPETYTAISVLDADFLVFPAGALFGWSSRWKHQSVPVCAVDFQNLK